MILETKRLRLTPLSIDALELFQAINTNEYVRKYLWDNQIMPVETFEQILYDTERFFKNERWGLWKMEVPGSKKIVGYAGLWLFFGENQPQLVYALQPEHTGYGYATEAAEAVTAYAFDHLNFSYLIASMDKENVASQKVCDRLGFRFVQEKEIEGKPILFYEKSNC